MLITAPNPSNTISAPRLQRSTVHHQRATGFWSTRANLMTCHRRLGERRTAFEASLGSSSGRAERGPGREAPQENGLPSWVCTRMQLCYQRAEGVAARFEIGELVERGAGRRQQYDGTRRPVDARLSGGGGDRRRQIAAAGQGDL